MTTAYSSFTDPTIMFSERFSTQTEQGVLRISIACTFAVSAIGIVFGLASRSFVIIFDSIYELTDVAMTALALLVSKLIAMSTTEATARSKLAERFTMGFWHLEPMVLGLNGTLLIGAAIYALINAADSFLMGGRRVEFDYAIVFGVVSLIWGVAMTVFVTQANKTIRSDFLALDAKSWFMGSVLTLAWLSAFIFGSCIEGTRHDWLTPYIDPIILALVCLVVIPLPVRTVRRALSDMLLVTPVDLKQHVDEVAQAVVMKHHFVGYRSYVARVGRGRQIELNFVVPTDWPPKRLEEWDIIRDEVEQALGDNSPHLWLTIVFTTDQEWAD